MKEDTLYVWEVEMFKDGNWVREKRIYYAVKQKSDFDIKDVDGKRRNAKMVLIITTRNQ